MVDADYLGRFWRYANTFGRLMEKHIHLLAIINPIISAINLNSRFYLLRMNNCYDDKIIR